MFSPKSWQEKQLIRQGVIPPGIIKGFLFSHIIYIQILKILKYRIIKYIYWRIDKIFQSSWKGRKILSMMYVDFLRKYSLSLTKISRNIELSENKHAADLLQPFAIESIPCNLMSRTHKLTSICRHSFSQDYSVEYIR